MITMQAYRLRIALAFSLVGAIFAIAACGGGGSALPGGQANTLQLKTPLASPTPGREPLAVTTTVPLTAGSAIAMPALGGVSGSFTTAYGSAPAGTTVTLTTYDKQPADAPAIVGAAVPIFWVRSTYSQPVNFSGFPSSLSYTLPTGFNTVGSGFSIETFDGTSGGLLDYQIGSLSGHSVSLGSEAGVSELPSHTYWWELLCGGTNPINIPLSSAGQNTKLAPLCGFTNTIVTIPSNNAVSGAYLSFSAMVSVATPATDAGFPDFHYLSPPPGTTTGLLSAQVGNIDSNVPEGVTYNSGLLAFQADVPPVISTAGKTFIATSCTFSIIWSGSGHSWTPCIDTPYVSGPLNVSGQTVSFPGIPYSVSLPAMTGSDCVTLTDCVQYFYIVSVFY